VSSDRVEVDQIAGVPQPETRSLVGHITAHDSIIAALDAGRPPSAIMLHGPRGIGKATFAFTLARELLTRTSDESAERVDAQIAALSHPNLFVLRRARDHSVSGKFYSAIRVEDVRATRDALQRTRGRAGYRIAIIDSVDDCNANSANALLKTLEEPPADTLFIVLSHRPGGLLPTIRSRCQSFTLRPLPDDQVSDIVRSIRPGIDTEALARAVRLAGGRPRRAFETLMLEDGDVLDALVTWLGSPDEQPVRAQLAIADSLAASKGAELSFAQDIIREWMAGEAESAARAGASARFRLASANALWDKASALFADADIYNLDRRQTLVSVFDLIRDHSRKFAHAA
jgi:DNA polymerase III subunit delta'